MENTQLNKQSSCSSLTSKTLLDAALVGRAFRCPDGLIRWITGLSSRKYFSCLWFDEEGQNWHNGGIIKTSDWQGGEEVPAPQKGETYFLVGSTGFVSEKTV